MHKQFVIFLLICCFSSLPIHNTYGAEGTVGRCAEIHDPYESINRKIFIFNKTLDKTLIRPPVLWYINLVPKWPRNRINSFFSNLTSPLTFVNNILQGDFKSAGQTFGRFLFNSTAGLGGLIDWASVCGVEDKPQIIEYTLAKFNVPYGTYIVIPFLGPSSARGIAGKITDIFINPVNWVLYNQKNHASTKYFLLEKFDQRAEKEDLIGDSEKSTLDEYSFVRSSYLQYIAAQNPLCKNQQEIDYELYN